METVSQESVQETKDPEWQKLETKKTKRKKQRRVRSKEEGANLTAEQTSAPLCPCYQANIW